MTVGIGCAGPQAGLAAWRALRAAEACGWGSVGGFVSLVAIHDGRVLRAETQRGGAASLFGDGPPPAIAAATRCGLISSGPDRGDPLSRFTPADGEAGLVTGHRMPDTPGHDGVPVNLAVLDAMRRGASPHQAVRRVVQANPRCDAGLIAVSRDGRVAAADTPTSTRPDGGRAVRRAAGMVVAVLHNAIEPHRLLAPMLADVALHAMRAATMRPDNWVVLHAGTRLEAAAMRGLDVDGAGVVRRILVADPALLHGLASFGVGYAAPVLRDGRLLGHATYEPFLVAHDGVLRSADGQARLLLPIQDTTG